MSMGSLEAQLYGTLVQQLPSVVLGIPVRTTVCGVSVMTPPPASVVEGMAMPTAPVVDITDSSGQGLAGKVRRMLL